MRAMWAAVTLLIINLLGFGLGPLIVGAFSDSLSISYGDDSLRLALLMVTLAMPWPILHFFRAGILIARERRSS